jgi:hypothetical protein
MSIGQLLRRGALRWLLRQNAESLCLFFQEKVEFVHQPCQLMAVFFLCNLSTELHPLLFVFALHSREGSSRADYSRAAPVANGTKGG